MIRSSTKWELHPLIRKIPKREISHSNLKLELSEKRKPRSISQIGTVAKNLYSVGETNNFPRSNLFYSVFSFASFSPGEIRGTYSASITYCNSSHGFRLPIGKLSRQRSSKVSDYKPRSDFYIDELYCHYDAYLKKDNK